MMLTSVNLYIMTTNQQNIGSSSFGQLAYILSKSKDHLILKRFEPVEAYEGICLLYALQKQL